MTITLYQNISDPRTVQKELTAPLDVSGVAREPLDLIDPVIEIEGNIETLYLYNYMYIAEYKRYYYIKPRADSYALNTITGHADALMNAWNNGLTGCQATLVRSQNYFNSYFVDSDMGAMAYKNVTTRAFPQGITGDSIILMTVG